MNRWTLRSAVVLAFVVALAAVLVSTDGSSIRLGRSPSMPTTESTESTTSTMPSPFPQIAPPETVRAVRTGTNLVLPVRGGEPGAWEVLTPCAGTAVVDGAPLAGAHLVLDPGHGGKETGAVGPSGLTEAALNLDVAHRAARRLEAAGAVVVMTRNSDVRMTLETRAEIAKAVAPMAFISVHHNAVPLSKSDRPGSELYHQLADPASRRLAGLLWEELQEELAPFATTWAVGDQPGALARQSQRTGDDYYGVLRRSQGIPAVLSEAAYLSDPQEDELLNTEEFREAEAKAITDAFTRFVSTSDPGSGFGPTKIVDTPAGGGGGSSGCEDPPLM